MSSPEPRHSHGEPTESQDPMDSVVHAIPVVIPVVGGLLIFLLASIAVYVA